MEGLDRTGHQYHYLRIFQEFTFFFHKLSLLFVFVHYYNGSWWILVASSSFGTKNSPPSVTI